MNGSVGSVAHSVDLMPVKKLALSEIEYKTAQTKEIHDIVSPVNNSQLGMRGLLKNSSLK